VIYTHSHADHFGGVRGVARPEEVADGRCTIIAPDGFMEHAVAENVYAGTAMTRRAGYMYGAALERGPAAQVGAGLGQTTSTGTVSLIAPTDSISATGDERTVDGIRMEFQLTPGTEAPAEMNVFFPDRAALCMAENATHVLHNILTIRGALDGIRGSGRATSRRPWTASAADPTSCSRRTTGRPGGASG
jgi:alkyl sulfatase BDS1-like metallo-beta-lactamase superfamily hydrolase